MGNRGGERNGETINKKPKKDEYSNLLNKKNLTNKRGRSISGESITSYVFETENSKKYKRIDERNKQFISIRSTPEGRKDNESNDSDNYNDVHEPVKKICDKDKPSAFDDETSLDNSLVDFNTWSKPVEMVAKSNEKIRKRKISEHIQQIRHLNTCVRNKINRPLDEDQIEKIDDECLCLDYIQREFKSDNINVQQNKKSKIINHVNSIKRNFNSCSSRFNLYEKPILCPPPLFSGKHQTKNH